MRLKSGKYLQKMTRPPMDNPSSHNNPQNIVEQPVRSTVEEAIILMPVRTTTLMVSSRPVALIPSQGMTPSLQPWNTLFNPTVARLLFGFSMPKNNMEYPHGMPTSMMVGLRTNISTYSDNATDTRPSYNPHNAFALTINNMVRPRGIS